MNQTFRDYFLLHIVVLVWGFTGVLGRLIQIPSIEIVFYRTLIAAFGLLVFMKITRKSPFFKNGIDYWYCLATGLIIAVHWITFFWSARLSTISVSLACMATTSIWTSFLEPLMTKQKAKPYEVVLAIIGFIGISIIFQAELHFITGIVVALLSAGLSAVFTVINARLIIRLDAVTITFHEMIGACASTLLFLLCGSLFMEAPTRLAITWNDLLYLVILGVLCTVFAFTQSIHLMKRLSAFSVNLSVNLEPVYGILLAFLIFGNDEKMSLGFYFGAAIILTSVLIYPLLNKKYNRKPLDTDVLR